MYTVQPAFQRGAKGVYPRCALHPKCTVNITGVCTHNVQPTLQRCALHLQCAVPTMCSHKGVQCTLCTHGMHLALHMCAATLCAASIEQVCTRGHLPSWQDFPLHMRFELLYIPKLTWATLILICEFPHLYRETSTFQYSIIASIMVPKSTSLGITYIELSASITSVHHKSEQETVLRFESCQVSNPFVLRNCFKFTNTCIKFVPINL